MKKIAIILLVLITFFTGSSTQPSMIKKEYDVTDVQIFSQNQFAQYMSAQGFSTYEIINEAYSVRTGDYEHFVCRFEVCVKDRNNAEEVLEYGYYIEKTSTDNFEILSEGATINESILTESDDLS